MSGCWSYLVEMYCLIASDSDTLWVRRKGRSSILLAVVLGQISPVYTTTYEDIFPVSHSLLRVFC